MQARHPYQITAEGDEYLSWWVAEGQRRTRGEQ
jgi:hypothetical protein